jgi:hypothetical protein
LLLTSEAKTLTHQCSRDSHKDLTDTWVPTKLQLEQMESKLPSIARLTTKACCLPGAKIEDAAKWNFQYVGIVVKRKKLIYISAVSTDHPSGLVQDAKSDTYKFEPSNRWRTQAIVICDGETTCSTIRQGESSLIWR